jgi:ceramide glucosyltransferase
MLQLTATILLALAGVGCLLHCYAAFRLARFLRFRPPTSDAPAPMTFWRALKPGVPDLVEKLDALTRSTRPEDQLLIGVDAESPDHQLCLRWRAHHADRDIHIVSCEPGHARNPKISKFCQMRSRARHEHWLLIDSEALLTRETTEALRAEWLNSGADAFTSGYRFSGMRTAVAWLDTLPAAITLWPGLMIVPRLTFTLGACVGLKACDLDELGGWAALGDHLAEDHELGQRLTAAGRTIALSRMALTLESDPLTARDYLRHQHRLAVTYRAANPAGALGLPIFHVLPAAIAAAILHPPLWQMAEICAAVRVITGWIEARLHRMASLEAILLIPFILLLEGVFWLLAWLPLPVWWAGRRRSITYRGVFR